MKMAKGYLLYKDKEYSYIGDDDYYREDIAIYLNKEKAEEEKARLNKELSRKERAYPLYSYNIEELEIIE